MKFSPKQSTHYINNEPHECPFCKASDLKKDYSKIEDYGRVKVICESCLAQWDENWNITYLELRVQPSQNYTAPEEVVLTSSQKRELRSLYGKYMNAVEGIDVDEFETSDDKRDYIETLVGEYQQKFPQLKQKLETVDELIYSANQLQFIEDVRNCSVLMDWTYSGRAMYGDVCPSVILKDRSQIGTSATILSDNMGLDTVIYAKI